MFSRRASAARRRRIGLQDLARETSRGPSPRTRVVAARWVPDDRAELNSHWPLYRPQRRDDGCLGREPIHGVSEGPKMAREGKGPIIARLTTRKGVDGLGRHDGDRGLGSDTDFSGNRSLRLKRQPALCSVPAADARGRVKSYGDAALAAPYQRPRTDEICLRPQFSRSSPGIAPEPSSSGRSA